LKRILLDTNVVLDVLLDRAHHAAAGAAVWTLIERGAAEGMLAAHAITTIHYLARKARGAAGAQRIVHDLLKVFRIAPVDESVARAALRLGWADFEDAVTAAAAQAAGCEWIVTRDPRGFAGAPVDVLPPEAAAALLRQT
jgi:predicted nucleic acid-binding protein